MFPRVLVVTLFSGENEFEECVASVQIQKGVRVDHVVIKNLPKQVAHQRLFEMFNRRRGEFDYLAKLDADMKFSQADALAQLICLMSEDIDLLSVSVWDEMTSDYMQSFNIFSNRCVFSSGHNDPLFTDRVPIFFPGRQIYRVDRMRYVHHAFNPSPFQAFMFGVHRAMKVMQHDARWPRVENAYHQMKIIRKVATKYSRNGSDVARLACVGAGFVMSRRISDATLVLRDDYQHIFSSLLSEPLSSVLISACRKPPILGVLQLWGFGRFSRAVGSYIKRKGMSRLFKGAV